MITGDLEYRRDGCRGRDGIHTSVAPSSTAGASRTWLPTRTGDFLPIVHGTRTQISSRRPSQPWRVASLRRLFRRMMDSSKPSPTSARCHRRRPTTGRPAGLRIRSGESTDIAGILWIESPIPVAIPRSAFRRPSFVAALSVYASPSLAHGHDSGALGVRLNALERAYHALTDLALKSRIPVAVWPQPRPLAPTQPAVIVLS